MANKQKIKAQKELEDILIKLGFEPEDEYEYEGVMFTKYANLLLGVRIERTL